MRTTEMVLIALFLKTSKFLPASVSIYILSLCVPLYLPHFFLIHFGNVLYNLFQYAIFAI